MQSTNILFNEIYYRKSREDWIKDARFYIFIRKIAIFSGIVMIVTLVFCSIYDGINITNIPVVGAVGYTLFWIWSLKKTYSYNCWITITFEGIYVNLLNRFLPKASIKKIVINCKKERLIIFYTKNNKDKKLVLDRDINLLNSRFLSHDQFERFKKAMEVLGVEYEIIWR